VTVASPNEPSGETILLSAAGGGLFTGSIPTDTTASVSANGILRVSPGTTITVTYNDADDGSGNPATVTGSAKIQTPADVFVESRSPNGSVNPAPNYLETAGSWSSTGSVTPNAICIKSMAPGLNGLGGRYSASIGAKARFRPTLTVPGFYNVYVTLPNATRGADNHSPGAGFKVVHDGTDINGVVNLSPTTTPSMADQWHLLASGVQFAAGNGGYVELTNNNPSSNATGQRFSADSVRFVFTQPLPVKISLFIAD